MARSTKKMICHDCRQVFNRKPQNGDNQVCWNCKSTRVTLVTDPAPPQSATAPVTPPTPQAPKMPQAPQTPSIPQAPSADGLKMPTFAGKPGGGAITPQMLLQQKKKLKAVKILLPGPENSLIPTGIRMLAHLVRNPIVTGAGLRLATIWNPRNSFDEYLAFTDMPSIDLAMALRNIASGIPNPDGVHHHANGRYWNNTHEMPHFKKRRGPHPLQGIVYREYGWTRAINPYASWYGEDDNGVRSNYSGDDNKAANLFVRNVRHGKVFSERLMIAVTGEVFYSPDHYITFFRYHPSTREWYRYHSAAGAGGPKWDESFYEERLGGVGAA